MTTATTHPAITTLDSAASTARDRLLEKHGDGERSRITAGIERVRSRWTDRDGDPAAFEHFVTTSFVPIADLPRLLDRLERGLEYVGGHLYEMRRHLRRWSDLRGTPDESRFQFVDDLLATFDPAPDIIEESYRQKLAFVTLLNCRRPDLDEMLRDGPTWPVERWAEARLAQHFGPRIPKEVNDLARAVSHRCNTWVSGFHVPVGSLRDERGDAHFEPGRALLAHWLVREEIKAGYNDPDRERGLRKQRALAWVMARHIDGSIPEAVMSGTSDRPWQSAANTVDGAAIAPAATVGTVRYERWLEQRDLAFVVDRHHPEHPTAIARKCELDREIPERDVERLLVSLLSAPVRRTLAAFLRNRLGRPLEPFDIYVDEFADARPAEEMNALVRKLATDAASLERQLPELLRGLGFKEADAEFLGTRIRVEIAKGSGHAMRPQLPEYGAWLRTSSLEREIGWDGFDTAMHELGHTIEQLISTHFVPRPALRGVPNTACTEAFAFLYQSLGKRVLGAASAEDEERAFDIDTVQTLASACQIAGPALLELRIWNWIYRNPGASAESLRAEVLSVAESLWNEHYREDFGEDPYHILAAYQHMIAHPLYLPDYPIGHIISHQVRSHMRGKDLATETRRICSIGSLTPDLWMRHAVDSGIDTAPLVRDAARALERLA
ncbi:MAG: hypothetical protein JNL80_02855 [Phycisphaerae bacterium]|jgi:hypothetical protein|nr:hypothetical protein [Phycisphaerae bacterium]